METTSLLVRERAFREAPEALSKSLKNHSIANFYKCALLRIVHNPPSRQGGLELARLLWKAISYDPMLTRKGIVLKILINAVITTVLPPECAKLLLEKFKNLSNFNALLGYMRAEPTDL